MFYYPAVLRRHTGCFSTIWLVATKGIRVTRRDFLKVNVTKTCDDIMDYLMERVEAPRSDLPRPRFSLYLSSQLQYGVILVYHRQCAILLEETQYVVDWLLKQKIPSTNDMDDHSRPASFIRSMLSLMEQTEGAPDPLFGEMYMQEDLPSPRALLQGHLRDKSPPHPSQEQERSPPVVREALKRGITASPEAITLREPEPVSMPFSEYEGMELADHVPHTIDLLLAETDQFFEGEILGDVPGAEAGIEPEREEERGREAESERTRKPTESTDELQPISTTLSSEDQVLLPQDETHLPLGPPAPPVGQITPPSAPVVPSPPAAARDVRHRDGTESGQAWVQRGWKRRRRRRQLVFIDLETQLSPEELREQINDPHTQTTAAALLPCPSARPPSALDLLEAPITAPLAEDLQLLWRRAMVVTPVSGPDLQFGERGPESTDSEVERGAFPPQTTEGAELERTEESAKEMQRDVAEAEQLDVMAMETLFLEASDQMESSREMSPLFTPDKEGPRPFKPVSVMQHIPEEAADFMAGPAPRSLGSPEFVECEKGPVSFLSVLPQGASRRTVSHLFVKLLGDLSSRKLQVEQREPYGDILLSVRSGSP